MEKIIKQLEEKVAACSDSTKESRARKGAYVDALIIIRKVVERVQTFTEIEKKDLIFLIFSHDTQRLSEIYNSLKNTINNLNGELADKEDVILKLQSDNKALSDMCESFSNWMNQISEVSMDYKTMRHFSDFINYCNKQLQDKYNKLKGGKE